MTLVTRFAPTPSGLLHIGHAHSALFAWRLAQEAGGRFLLRIEDIDGPRSRPEFETAILEDLTWLGLEWETPVRRQSEQGAAYQQALDRVAAADLLYPCFCTRRQIREEATNALRAPHGPDGPLYPGTCRNLSTEERTSRQSSGDAFALRLDTAKALALGGPLTWVERGPKGAHGSIAADPLSLGDVVLARKEIPTSYHLAVTVDDAAQGVTLVTRGRDLQHTTHIHRLLQSLLGLPVPEWQHHDLLTDDRGERLAKRNDALSLRAMRDAGKSPEEVRALAGFPD